MGNVCLSPVTVDETAHQTKIHPDTNIIKGRVAPVITEESNYNQKMIEPKVKNMKRQLAL
jgi:hypothetical protein